MLFFVALFPYFALEGQGISASSRRAGCLLPPTCLALGTLAFAEFEDSGEVGRCFICSCFCGAVVVGGGVADVLCLCRGSVMLFPPSSLTFRLSVRTHHDRE